jgi:hypothetical protein
MATSDANALLLQVSADIRGLEKAMERASGVVGKGSRRMRDELTGLERFFGKTSIPRALDKVFDSTRFKVLDSGVARVGLFGSALEALGPAGLTAAAAIGALALSFAEVKKSIDWADKLDEASDRTGISTTKLQEFDLVAIKAGISIQSMREALEGLNIVLGKVQAGTAKGNVIKAFEALGFGKTAAEVKETLRGYKDAADILPKIADALNHVPTGAGREALANALDLKEVLPALKEGSAGIDRFIKQIHEWGIVADEELIRKGAKAADQMDELHARIDGELKVAFLQLTPALVTALRALSDFLDKLNSFHVPQALSDFIAWQQSYIAWQSKGGIFQYWNFPKADAGSLPPLGQGHAAPMPQSAFGHTTAWNPVEGGGGTDRGPQQAKRLNEMLARSAEAILKASDNEFHSAEERAAVARKLLDIEEQARAEELKDLVATKGLTAAGAKLVAAKDKELFAARRKELDAKLTADLEAASLKVAEDLNKAVIGILTAQEDLATTAEARGRLEAEIFERERALERRKLQDELAIDPNKTADQKTSELNAFDFTTELQRQRQAALRKQAIADEENSILEASLQGQIDAADAAGQLAQTQKQRRDAALRILDLEDQLERLKLQEVIASQTATAAEKAIAQKRLDVLNETASARRDIVRQNTAGPVEQFVRENSPDKAVEHFQQIGVNAFDRLADSLAEAAANGENLGNVLLSFVRSLLQELVASSIKSATSSLLTSVFGIPGYASGTLDAPGGIARVHKDETILLPKHSVVMTAAETRRAMTVQPRASTVIVGGPTFVLHSPVVTQDLIDQMQAISRNTEERAVARSLVQGKRSLPTTLRSDALLRQ